MCYRLGPRWLIYFNLENHLDEWEHIRKLGIIITGPGFGAKAGRFSKGYEDGSTAWPFEDISTSFEPYKPSLHIISPYKKISI